MRARVPIYCAVSWTSLVSLKAAFWIEPLLDVYEVGLECFRYQMTLTNFLGIYYLRLLSASHQLHWGRARSHNPYAWSQTGGTPMAP